VEAAKRRLSSSEAASIDLPFWAVAGGGGGLHADITRRCFEELSRPLRRRLWPPLERIGRRACVEWAGR
jgi:molecular chaperone DnaK (HSP70)